MKRPTLILLLFAFLTSPISSRVWARSSQASGAEEIKALKQEIEALKARQVRLEQELQELKKALAARGISVGPSEVVLDVAGDHFKGEAKARVAVIEFSDYQ